MDFTVIKTIVIALVILGVIFTLFYHTYEIGKSEEPE